MISSQTDICMLDNNLLNDYLYKKSNLNAESDNTLACKHVLPYTKKHHICYYIFYSRANPEPEFSWSGNVEFLDICRFSISGFSIWPL